MSALQRADAIVDIPAARSALASDANKTGDSGYMLGNTRVEWIDSLYQVVIATPLSALHGSVKSYSYDHERGGYPQREVVCKGNHHRYLY